MLKVIPINLQNQGHKRTEKLGKCAGNTGKTAQ